MFPDYGPVLNHALLKLGYGVFIRIEGFLTIINHGAHSRAKEDACICICSKREDKNGKVCAHGEEKFTS